MDQTAATERRDPFGRPRPQASARNRLRARDGASPWPIEQTDTSDGRVDGKTLRRGPRAVEVPLQHVIHRDRGLPEVADEVMQAVPDAAGNIVLITACHRLHGVMIHELIGCENLPVRRLRRIIILFILRTRLRILGNLGARQQGQHRRQH
jgi:hypothetical protein